MTGLARVTRVEVDVVVRVKVVEARRMEAVVVRRVHLMYSPLRAVLRTLRRSSSSASAREVPPPVAICNMGR